MGEGKRQVLIASRQLSTPRLRNNWDFEAHYCFLLSSFRLVWPLMGTFSRSNVLRNALRSSIVTGSRRGVANKAYPDHIPLSTFEHAFLTVGTGLAAFLEPRRGGKYDKFANLIGAHVLRLDMVAAFGELTAGPVLPRLRDKMLASEEGRAILKERPRINTQTVDMAALSSLPEDTFGRAYITWLERCGVTPDTRAPVRSSGFGLERLWVVYRCFRFITSMTQSSHT